MWNGAWFSSDYLVITLEFHLHCYNMVHETTCYKIQLTFIKSDQKVTLYFRTAAGNYDTQSKYGQFLKCCKLDFQKQQNKWKGKTPGTWRQIYIYIWFVFFSYNKFLYYLGIISITVNKIFSVCFSFVWSLILLCKYFYVTTLSPELNYFCWTVFKSLS